MFRHRTGFATTHRGADSSAVEMPRIDPPDAHRLNAAIGWAELGLHADAISELDRLPRALLGHPQVLDVRWKVHALAKDWESALVASRAQVHVAPDEVSGWINQSYTLHEMKRTGEAFDALSAVAAEFPEEGTIPYNLACYTCQLGRLEEARFWLNEARRLIGRDALRRMAKDDLDLKPLRSEL